MAFDIDSAKPVEKSGFDISSSKPVEDTAYDVSEFDDSTLGRLARKAKLAGRELFSSDKNPTTRTSVTDKLATGAREGVFNLASSIPASAAGGLAGIAGAVMPGPEGQGAQWAQGVQKALTYEPKTETGKLISEAGAAPLSMASEYAGKAGGAVGQVMGGDKGEAAGRSIGEAAPAVAATLIGGRAALKERPGTVKEAEAGARAEAVSRAEMKAGESGLNWGKLPVVVRKHLADLASDALTFDKMTPEMIKRAASLESLPVPVKGTKGQLTRDPVQLRTEKQLSQMDSGAPIENRYVEQNKALLDNLDTLANKGSAKATTPEEVGKQVVDKTLQPKQREARRKVSQAYEKANASAESAETVSPYPLIDYVQDHPNAAAVGWIVDRLKKQQIVTGLDDLGQPMVSRDIKLKEVSELRKVAERVAASGGEGSGWAPEVKSILDKMIEGKGGGEYAKARELYKTYKSEFDNQKAVRQLVENSGGKYSTDRKVALEDVFKKSVLDGSIDDLKRLRTSLLESESKGTRKQGRKAVNDLAAETVRYIKKEATQGTKDMSGAPEVSAAQLKKAVARIGDEKLDMLLGKTSADQLRAVVDAAQDIKTSPPGRQSGSDTAVNAMNWINKFLDHVPFAGPFTKGVAKLSKKAYDLGKSDMLVDEALLNKDYTNPYLLSDQRELRAFLPAATAASLAERRQ